MLETRLLTFRRVGWLCAALASPTLACSSQEFPPRHDGDGGNQGGSGGAGGEGPLPDSGPSPTNTCGVSVRPLMRVAETCNFALTVTPPAPSNVRVQTGDGGVVPKSDTDGWAYQPDLLGITLTGSYCQGVLDGTITDLTMLFGCLGGPIP